MKVVSDSELVEKALQMLPFSYAPYSGFFVGAALLCADGSVYTGCNIENVSFGPSNCAERTAFFKAISEGKKDFISIAIVGGPKGLTEKYCPPCGVCRQVMREFCGDSFRVIMAKSKNDFKVRTLSELLPESFYPQSEIGSSAS